MKNKKFHNSYIVNKKVNLVKSINILKSYPLDQIYSALDFLINEKNPFMTRSTKLKIIIKDNVRLGISCAPPKKEDPPSFI